MGSSVTSVTTSLLRTYFPINIFSSVCQKSAAMPDLRIIVLGCLALASVVAGRGEIITGCLFSPDCKTDDLRELAKELKDLRDQVFFNEQLPGLVRCVGVIEMTEVEMKMD